VRAPSSAKPLLRAQRRRAPATARRRGAVRPAPSADLARVQPPAGRDLLALAQPALIHERCAGGTHASRGPRTPGGAGGSTRLRVSRCHEDPCSSRGPPATSGPAPPPRAARVDDRHARRRDGSGSVQVRPVAPERRRAIDPRNRPVRRSSSEADTDVPRSRSFLRGSHRYAVHGPRSTETPTAERRDRLGIAGSGILPVRVPAAGRPGPQGPREPTIR